MSDLSSPSDINAFVRAVTDITNDPSFSNFKKLIAAFDSNVRVLKYDSTTNIEHDGRVIYCIPDERIKNRKCFNYLAIDGGKDILLQFGKLPSAYIMNVSKKFQCQQAIIFDYHNGHTADPNRRISESFRALIKIMKGWKNKDICEICL